MLEIKYEIKLNDRGRPCIDMPPNNGNRIEDKFFAFEIARYLLQGTYSGLSPEFDPETKNKIFITIQMLGQISDDVAKLLWENMRVDGQAFKLIGTPWDVSVQTEEERDAIPEHGIVYNERLYLREAGLKVFVIQGGALYELQGGTTNDHWVEIDEFHK
jgi:hypothetical protein